MNTFDKKMEEVFDVSATPITPKVEKLPALAVTEDPDLKGDLNVAYDQTKDNLQDLIDIGKDGLDEILQIAKAGQHPRAFEVFATLLKNVGELNDKLLDNQKKMRVMDGNKKEVNNTNIDKAVFVGTTADLAKMLKNDDKNQLQG
jgi:hypothetical protein